MRGGPLSQTWGHIQNQNHRGAPQSPRFNRETNVERVLPFDGNTILAVYLLVNGGILALLAVGYCLSRRDASMPHVRESSRDPEAASGRGFVFPELADDPQPALDRGPGDAQPPGDLVVGVPLHLPDRQRP